MAPKFLIIKTDGETGTKSQCGAAAKTPEKAWDLKARMRAQQQPGSSNSFDIQTVPTIPTGVDELPELVIGQNVRVFRTHAAGRLCDAATGRYAEGGLVKGDSVIGTVRERSGDLYRVTVIRNGAEFFIDWMARHWIRTIDEPAPLIRRW